jgi:hypothetical protein
MIWVASMRLSEVGLEERLMGTKKRLWFTKVYDHGRQE